MRTRAIQKFGQYGLEFAMLLFVGFEIGIVVPGNELLFAGEMALCVFQQLFQSMNCRVDSGPIHEVCGTDRPELFDEANPAGVLGVHLGDA